MVVPRPAVTNANIAAIAQDTRSLLNRFMPIAPPFPRLRPTSATSSHEPRLPTLLRVCRQFPDRDRPPAPQTIRHQSRSAVHLDRNRSLGDAARGMVGGVGEVRDLLIVDPDGDVRNV